MKSIGYIRPGKGFIRTDNNINGDCIDHWACDEFKVDHVTDNKHLKFKIIFRTATGEEVVIDKWGMRELVALSMQMNGGSILWRELTEHGVRCCNNPKATTAILNAFQKPDLVGGDYNYEH